MVIIARTALGGAPYDDRYHLLRECDFPSRGGTCRYQTDITDTQIRDGFVRRFEFTYELSVKILKRYLEFAASSPGIYKEMAFQDVIRSANEQNLLSGDWPKWREYRDMRGKTSHSYAEETALQVVKAIPDFLAEAAFLRDMLRRKLG